MKSEKPVVHFETDSAFVGEVGQCAYVKAIGHPEFPSPYYVRTSSIVKVFKDGSFETRNTLYKPQQS